jgi:protein O-GlcNAc transferase
MKIDQHLRKAQSLARKGDYDEAERLYGEVLASFPSNRQAVGGLRDIYLSPASGAFARSIQQVQALYGGGRYDEAIAQLRFLLMLRPQARDLHNFAGAVHAAAGRRAEAIAAYDVAIGIDPSYAAAHSNRAGALRDLGRLDEALASADAAIAIDRDLADAHLNRGIILHQLQRTDAALASYARAIELVPNLVDAHFNRALALRDRRDFAPAVESFDRAIRFRADHADAWMNRGSALQELGLLDEAQASFTRALAIRPDHGDTHFNRANVLIDLALYPEAAADYARAIALKPGFVHAISRLLFAEARMCRWDGALASADVASLGVGGDAVCPFSMLALDDDGARHLRRSANWVRTHYAAASPALPRKVVRGDRIVIGYFSADFQEHATMHLMAQLFEKHDKARFEIHAFSFRSGGHDAMRQRLIDAVDHFHDVGDLGDDAVAELARAHGVDIAIDLKGYTHGARPNIFACRAAPIQIAWLGYPGTMGADFIDYMIADEVMVPADKRAYVSEKLIALPGSYQVNDRSRAIGGAVPTRAALGLPEQGFVFCSFNASYKIGPAEYDIWMRLLAQVEGSVLWLLRDNVWAEANLRAEAAARGIDPSRLVFADRAPAAEHLARQRHADLFLDSFACNAHTTASDALWAGLPVITKLGDSFAARVAGSLLHAVGMPDLVTDSTEAYEALALDLARHTERLAEVRARLDRNRLTTPLFDCDRFTAHIERAYVLVQARYEEGLEPVDIVVPPVG